MIEKQIKKESYERSELTVTIFSEEDVIVTSGDSFLDDFGHLFPSTGDNDVVFDDGNGTSSMPGPWM